MAADFKLTHYRREPGLDAQAWTPSLSKSGIFANPADPYLPSGFA